MVWEGQLQGSSSPSTCPPYTAPLSPFPSAPQRVGLSNSVHLPLSFVCSSALPSSLLLFSPGCCGVVGCWSAPSFAVLSDEGANAGDVAVEEDEGLPQALQPLLRLCPLPPSHSPLQCSQGPHSPHQPPLPSVQRGGGGEDEGGGGRQSGEEQPLTTQQSRHIRPSAIRFSRTHLRPLLLHPRERAGGCGPGTGTEEGERERLEDGGEVERGSAEGNGEREGGKGRPRAFMGEEAVERWMEWSDRDSDSDRVKVEVRR